MRPLRSLVCPSIVASLVALSSSSALATLGVEEGDFAPGTTELVSVASSGAAGNGVSAQSSVSSGGRYVAFASAARNLVPEDDNVYTDVFLRDRTVGTTELISVALDGTATKMGASYPSLSADGRYVAFVSASDDLVPGDNNNASDVFVRDVLTGATERVSVANDGSEASISTGAPGSLQGDISDDGRYVAFTSYATNLIPDQQIHCTNGATSYPCQVDVFVRDRVAGTTQLVSGSASGELGNGRSYTPSISGTGRYVAFYSSATNFVAGDESPTHFHNWDEVYVKDMVTGTVARATIATDGGEPNDQLSLADRPAISDDGRYVAFDSRASNLVPADTNEITGGVQAAAPITGFDLFVRDMVAGRTRRVSVASNGAEGRGYVTLLSVSMSADGRYVAFSSSAPNLVSGDTNAWHDVFVHDVLSGATERVSRNNAGVQGNLGSTYPSISPDGQHITFTSTSSNLVPNDANGTQYDIFVHDRGADADSGAITAEPGVDLVNVSGWVSFDGGQIGSVDDLIGDDPLGAVPGASATGADLVGASVAYRPEFNDLLFTWRTAGMPGPRFPAPPRTGEDGSATWQRSAVPGEVPSVATPIALTYVTSFTWLDGIDNRWEVRVRGTSLNPTFGLYQCASNGTCQARSAVLGGGIGITGNEVTVAVPLAPQYFSFSQGVALGSVRALSAAGDPTIASSTLDTVDIGHIVMPSESLKLGIAPAGTPVGDVAFDTDAVIAGNRFDATIGTAGLEAGSYRIWVRACFGSTCGTRSKLLTI